MTVTWWVSCGEPSLKGSEGTGSKETSNEKKTARAFIVGRTFKTDQSETIDFGRFKTTIRPDGVATTLIKHQMHHSQRTPACGSSTSKRGTWADSGWLPNLT
jgi:hypothetical protein